MIDDLNLSKVRKQIRITDNNYYTDLTHVTNSMLSVLNDKGPKGLQEFNKNIYSRSTAEYFVFGEAVHKAILEPDKFESDYLCIAKDMLPFPESTLRKKENKEFVEDFKLINLEKTILSEADYNKVLDMKNAFYQIRECRDLIEGCDIEKIYTGEWDNTGIRIKCKVDGVKEGCHIFDIKTTMNSNPNSFKDKCNEFGYIRQAAMYTYLTGIQNFSIVAIDKTFPHTVGIYNITEKSIAHGKAELSRLIEQYNTYFDKPEDNTELIRDFCYVTWI